MIFYSFYYVYQRVLGMILTRLCAEAIVILPLPRHLFLALRVAEGLSDVTVIDVEVIWDISRQLGSE